MRRPNRLAHRLGLCALALCILGLAPAFAHVTPNVQLVKKGEFVRQTLPGASRFLEKRLDLGAAQVAAIRHRTGWTPSDEEVKLYVGRDGQGGLVGSVVFLWIPSEHGPVGVGVAFDPGGRIVRADVTDAGSEPLAWIQPLLGPGGLAAFAGLPPSTPPDPAGIAPGVRGRMSRYYAEVIAAGVLRAQAIEQAAFPAGR
jgi:hypothetical protein